MNILHKNDGIKRERLTLNTQRIFAGNKTLSVSHWQWALFALLQVFNLYQLLTHAMWRDELQTWSMARESSTIVELFRNMRYDGYPPLWYLSLWGLSFISNSPLAMQLFHFACSLLAQTLIMTRAPFPGTMRLAVVAGYYLSFEYCIISRAYVLGLLLICIFCAFHAWFAKHRIIRGGIMGLLANTSVYGAILSLAFVADDLCGSVRKQKEAKDQGKRESARVAGFMIVYGAFLLTAIAFMLPPNDGTYAAGWSLQPDLADKFYLFSRNLLCLVPVPTPKIAFWNSLAALDAGMWIAYPLSLMVMFAVWLALRATPRYLRMFVIGFLGIWIFSVVKYVGTVRHIGSLMILFIACIWLANSSHAVKQFSTSRSSQIAIWCVLSANLFAWGMASYYHLRFDFSGSHEMAQIIRHSGKILQPIIADTDYATSSVAGYLGHPFVYVTNRKSQTFIRWNRERTGGGSMEALSLAHNLAMSNNGKSLLLLNYPLETGSASLLARTRDAIVSDEVFYLYEYER